MRGLFRQQPDPILLCSDPQDLRHGHQGHPNGESLPLWQRSGRGHGRKEDRVLPSRVPMDHDCNFLFLQVWFIKFGSVSFQI